MHGIVAWQYFQHKGHQGKSQHHVIVRVHGYFLLSDLCVPTLLSLSTCSCLSKVACVSCHTRGRCVLPASASKFRCSRAECMLCQGLLVLICCAQDRSPVVFAVGAGGIHLPTFRHCSCCRPPTAFGPGHLSTRVCGGWHRQAWPAPDPTRSLQQFVPLVLCPHAPNTTRACCLHYAIGVHRCLSAPPWLPPTTLDLYVA